MYILCILALIFSPALAQTDTLQALLDEYVTAGDAGVVLLVSTPDDTWMAAAGLADFQNETRVQTDDLFRIASVTKSFVAALTLRLAEEGELALDAPIQTYLAPEFYEQIPYHDDITIRQLLNMTAGLYDYTESDAFNDLIDKEPSYPWTAMEAFAFTYDAQSLFAPGEGWSYSNSNYILLQIILENVTGEPLADLLEAYIFGPLDMEDTFLEMPGHFAEGIVHGYAGREDVTFVNDGVGLGDGGIITDADDLAAFLPALFAGELVGEDMLAEMLQLEEDDEGEGYGLGISRTWAGDVDLLGHSGSSSGFNAEMWHVPDYALTIVVLTNDMDSDISMELVFDVVDVFVNEME